MVKQSDGLLLALAVDKKSPVPEAEIDLVETGES